MSSNKVVAKDALLEDVLPLTQAREGFAAMASGELFGKIVFTV